MDDSRNRGTQPVDALMDRWGLGNHDLVDASPEQLTHKQVQRARKGRVLTLAMMQKLARSLNIAVWYRLTKDEREDYFEYLHKHYHDHFLQPCLKAIRKDRDGWDISSGEPGHRLRAIRKRLGLGQKEMARQIGVGAVTLLEWENLRRVPSKSARQKIEAFCHAHSMPCIFGT